MTITEFLTARLDEDEAAARAADISEGDLTWTVHGPVALSSPRAFRVRTGRDMVPVALVQDVDGEGDPTGILDAEAAATHVALHDPARALADIAAKRAIVAEFEQVHADYQVHHTPTLEGQRFGLMKAVSMLAQPYAEHPDYDPAWRV